MSEVTENTCIVYAHDFNSAINNSFSGVSTRPRVQNHNASLKDIFVQELKKQRILLYESLSFCLMQLVGYMNNNYVCNNITFIMRLFSVDIRTSMFVFMVHCSKLSQWRIPPLKRMILEPFGGTLFQTKDQLIIRD